MKYCYALLLLAILSACSDKAADSDAPEPINADAVIRVNMTYDRNIDFDVNKIAIVPNSVAPWAGSLFVIDSDNNLRRGDIDRGDFKNVATNIKDLAPLARDKSAGILFTQTLDGSVSAFFEINDEGGYRDIPLKTPLPTIDSFCSVNKLSQQTVYAKSGETISALELISPTNNGYIVSADLEGQTPQKLPHCALNTAESDVVTLNVPPSAIRTTALDKDLILFTTEESLRTPRLFVQNKDQITAIDITGGLTTEAPSRIDSFYVIENSLGGVLRDGAIILADNESKRLIYISLDFFKTRLSEIAPEQ